MKRRSNRKFNFLQTATRKVNKVIQLLFEKHYSIQRNRLNTIIFECNRAFYITNSKKTFIQIVSPITIRPRNGNAETGYKKLQKTTSTIRVGKRFMKSIRQKKNKVMILS